MLAFRIIRTGEKDLPLARCFLNEITAAARLRAFYASGYTLGSLAFRVSAAGDIASKTSTAYLHRSAAIGAFLVDLLGLALQRLGILAIRITGAGQEFPVTANLDDHRLAAFFANLVSFFLGSFADLFLFSHGLVEIDLERPIEFV